jgi:hypothetical protein
MSTLTHLLKPPHYPNSKAVFQGSEGRPGKPRRLDRERRSKLGKDAGSQNGIA